jgi:hypothetical protein
VISTLYQRLFRRQPPPLRGQAKSSSPAKSSSHSSSVSGYSSPMIGS